MGYDLCKVWLFHSTFSLFGSELMINGMRPDASKEIHKLFADLTGV